MSNVYSEYFKDLIWVIVIVFVTQTLFFVAYSYLMCGDPLLALSLKRMFDYEIFKTNKFIYLL